MVYTAAIRYNKSSTYDIGIFHKPYLDTEHMSSISDKFISQVHVVGKVVLGPAWVTDVT